MRLIEWPYSLDPVEKNIKELLAEGGSPCQHFAGMTTEGEDLHA